MPADNQVAAHCSNMGKASSLIVTEQNNNMALTKQWFLDGWQSCMDTVPVIPIKVETGGLKDWPLEMVYIPGPEGTV